MTVLVTGAAGFIGYHVANALLDRGIAVLGIDSLNADYNTALKEARLARLRNCSNFRFLHADLSDQSVLDGPLRDLAIQDIVHLAARAGVLQSIARPFDYLHSNVTGHLTILEFARRQKNFRHLVYASSAALYGASAAVPFAETADVNRPVSLYAATKGADELLSYNYAYMFGLPQTGLRFFTVYGPWGRPDMALWMFASAILENKPIRIFNYGAMTRDLTFVDDIVQGVLAALDRPPRAEQGAAPHRIYNIGKGRAENLMAIVDVLENSLGKKAIRQLEPMPLGDVAHSCADVSSIQRELGYQPSTPIETGIPRFVEWFLDYHRQS